MTDKQRDKFLSDIARDLRRKHDLELYKDCLAIAEKIYQLSKDESI